MKSEFMAAVTQLASERNIPKDMVLSILETALVSAYKKAVFSPEQDVIVKIDSTGMGFKVYVNKTVVESVSSPLTEISVAEAQKIRKDYQPGDIVPIESVTENAGRIAAQTAKQVVLQRLREAEHHVIFEQYTAKENEIISGNVRSIQPKQIIVTLGGKADAILPLNEQVSTEHYRPGQKMKFYLLEMHQGMRGPLIVISRSHPNLLRRLFETEIPEITSGTVEIKAIAREAGHRSKIAVVSHQSGVDAVGCCLGARGIRLQSIINELNGEKIDVIQWDSDPKVFISNAISPAQGLNIRLDEEDKTATVVVPDRQLSLAIGKEGQNARLAAKLTGWRIDIKSVSAAETEKINVPEVKEQPELITAEKEEAETGESITVLQEELREAEPVDALAVETLTELDTGETEGEEESVEEDIGVLLSREEFQSVKKDTSDMEDTPVLRFAEDIMPNREITESPRGKATGKGKAKGKGRKKKRESFVESEIED
jgi:N utilization substance protein A